MSSWESKHSSTEENTIDAGAIADREASWGGDTTRTGGVSVEEDEASSLRHQLEGLGSGMDRSASI